MKPVVLLRSLFLSCSALAQGTLKPGEVQLEMPGGGSYIGTVKDGVPDGKGYFMDPDGMQHEGEVRMGRRDGMAEGLFPNGDRYKGQWKDGKPDGLGAMSYMLGGSFMKDKELVSPVPLNVGYDALSPAQKQVVRDAYPALDDGDEPPYPLKGPHELFAALLKLGSRYRLNGYVTIFVTVGADGKVLSVATRGIDDPDARRVAGIGAGLLKYKPARCGAQTCQMTVPFKVTLETIVR